MIQSEQLKKFEVNDKNLITNKSYFGLIASHINETQDDQNSE